MTAEELYGLVICAGGAVIPAEGGAVRIKLPPGALIDSRDELRRRRSELADVALSERREFASQWLADVQAKRDRTASGIERWTRISWAVWAKSMIAIWQAEEMPDFLMIPHFDGSLTGVEDELRWLRELAGNAVREAVA